MITWLYVMNIVDISRGRHILNMIVVESSSLVYVALSNSELYSIVLMWLFEKFTREVLFNFNGNLITGLEAYHTTSCRWLF